MNTYSDESVRDPAACEARIIDAAAVSRTVSGLPPTSAQERLAAVFAALGDLTRARILLALAGGELCVCDLAEVAGVSESAVSHQLRLLRDLRLVAFDRQGKRAVYRLTDEHVRDLLVIGLAHAEEEGLG